MKDSRLSILLKKQIRTVVQTVQVLVVLTPLSGGQVKNFKNVILTDEIVSCIAKGFKGGQLLGAHPFEWDESANRPKLGNCSKTRKLIWIGNIIVCTSHYFFLIVQCVRYQLNEKSNQFFKVYTLFMVLVYGILPCNHIAIFLKQKQIPQYVASFMDFTEKYERSYILHNAASPTVIKMGNRFLFGIFYLFWTNTIIVLIYFLTYPTSPDLLSSVFFEHDLLVFSPFWETSKTLQDITVVVLAVLFQFYIELNFIFTCFLLIYSAIPTVFIGIVVLNEISSKTHKISKREVSSSWDIKFKIYRQLYILSTEAQDIFGFCLSYNKNIIQTGAVLCAHAFLRYTGFIALVSGAVGFTGFAYISGLLYSVALVNSRTCGLLKEWKAEIGLPKTRDEKVFCMTLVSVTPIKLHIGSSFIDRRLILSMYHGMFKSVVRTLQIKP